MFYRNVKIAGKFYVTECSKETAPGFCAVEYFYDYNKWNIEERKYIDAAFVSWKEYAMHVVERELKSLGGTKLVFADKVGGLMDKDIISRISTKLKKIGRYNVKIEKCRPVRNRNSGNRVRTLTITIL